MKHFEYADEKISEKEILIAVPSILIGIGILTLPAELTEYTVAADGWVAIAVCGVILSFVVWLIAKVAASFPNQEFLTYASYLVTRPVAILLTMLFSIQGVFINTYVVRVISDLAEEYLFDRTPVEVLGLCFLLVVVYAVSGSRAGLFRLNMMFLPIISFIMFLVTVFSFGLFEMDHFFPVFKTDLSGHVEGVRASGLSFLGFYILFFYIALVRKPKKAPKMAVLGMAMTVVIYVITFMISVGVFGNITTANLIYPVIEIAKQLEVPGGFFERFDSIFYVIWIMAIFNVMCMAFDATLFALKSVFPVKKLKLIFILSPVIFFLAMLPASYHEVERFGNILSHFGLILAIATALLLAVALKIRGVKKK